MKTNQKSLVLAALAIAGFAQVAPAPPSFPSVSGLYLYDVSTGLAAFVPDVGGTATYVGTVGDYSVNISATGVTLSGGSFPALNLDVAAAFAGPGATQLDVFYSDGAFGPTSGAYTLSSLGPAFGGPVVSSAYLGSTHFGQTTALGGSLDVYPFTVNAAGTINANSYYLTLEDAITGSEVSVSSTLSVVPEPSNLLAYALVLLPIGIGARRFLRKDRTA